MFTRRFRSVFVVLAAVALAASGVTALSTDPTPTATLAGVCCIKG